jgi:protein SCO1/2
MADPEVRIGRIAVAALAGVLAVAVAAGAAFALLRAWQVPAGGEHDSAQFIESIPPPRLQSAPQQQSTDPAPEFEQRLGARLPAGLTLIESTGGPVDWRAWAADGRPIVLLPAYYRCETLCGTVAHGALEALADTGLPPSAWRLVLFSIDPTDTPADARRLGAVYARYASWSRPTVYGGSTPELQLLTGTAAQTGVLARSVGFRWLDQGSTSGSAPPPFAHATGLVVLTPEGVVSRYLFGVRFEPSVLRAALVEAGEGRIGTFADRLLLACSHIDPQWGAYDGWVIGLMRVVALAVLAALAFWIWHHRSPGSADGAAKR